MKQFWYFLDSGYEKPGKNMDIDLYLLNEVIKNTMQPVLRIYGWKPEAVSIGRNQVLKSIDESYCREKGMEIVVRPTGGRAIYHQGDITYSFVIKSDMLEKGNSVIESYKEISEALIAGLSELGIRDVVIAEGKQPYTKSSACMAVSTGADLEYKGKKIAGSAQLRREGYILQHGSILVNQDFAECSKIFNVDPLTMACLNISELLGAVPSYEDLSNAIRIGFENKFQVEFKTFSA